MRLILHIGAPKTGSTALQIACFQHRRKLLKNGFLYPRFGVQLNHNLLSLPFKSALPRAYRAQLGPTLMDTASASERAWATLKRQAHKSRAHTLVLTGEYFFRINSHAEFLARLQEAVPDLSEIKIHAYLRRPSESYLSHAQQVLRASSSLPQPRRPKFSKPLVAWARIGDVVVREFSTSTLENRDIVADFLLHGLASELDWQGSSNRRENASLSGEGMAILQRFHQGAFPLRDHLFAPESERLVEALYDVERSSSHHSPPQLLPELQAHLDRPHRDDAALVREFGFRFQHLPLKFRPSRRVRPGPVEQVSDVVRIDQNRLDELASQVLLHLLSEPYSTRRKVKSLLLKARRRWPLP